MCCEKTLAIIIAFSSSKVIHTRKAVNPSRLKNDSPPLNDNPQHRTHQTTSKTFTMTHYPPLETTIKCLCNKVSLGVKVRFEGARSFLAPCNPPSNLLTP